MSTIASLNVKLTAAIGEFTNPMAAASRTIAGMRAGFAAATDSTAAYERALNQVGRVKLAGAETIQSLRGALVTARAELQRFASHRDVQVQIEIGRELLDESWIKARANLQRLVKGSHLDVLASIVSDRSHTAKAWIAKQRQAVTKPIVAHIGAKADKFNGVYESVRMRIEGLRRFRAIRIALAATDAVSPIARAALASLAPLGRMASHGIRIVLHASQAGVALGVNKAKQALGSLAGFTKSLVGNIASSLSGIGVALAAVAGGAGLTVLIKDSMEAIAVTGRLSDRLGIATEKLGGMQYAAKLAGVDSEAMSMGLEHMLKNLSEAADKGGPAADAIARMGLNAKQLASEAPDKAFNQIADGLKGITNASDRGRAAMELFGRSGQQLLPLMLQGSAGIAAAQKEAEKLGITFNRTDAAKVEAANQSFVRMQAVVTGAAQRIAVELAPYIEAAANKLTSLATTGRGAAAYITDGFQAVTEAIASSADYLAVAEAGWNFLRAIAAKAIGGILDGVGSLIDGINKLSAKLHIAAIGGADDLHAMAKAFGDTANDAFAAAGDNMKTFNDATNSKAASRLFQDIRDDANKSAQAIAANSAALNAGGAATEGFAESLQKTQEDAKKVVETLDELHKSVATFGQTEQQKKLFDLKELGATPEQIEQAKASIDKLTDLTNAKKAQDTIASLQKEIDQVGMSESAKKLADLKLPGVDDATLNRIKELGNTLDRIKEGQKVWDETRSPLEKFHEQEGKLSDLLNSGAIDWDTYGRAIRKAREELEKTADAMKGPQLMDTNAASTQQYEYELQHKAAFDDTAGAQRSDPNKDVVAKQSYNEQYQMRLLLQQINDNLITTNADPTTTLSIT